jgi:hypothetical protein
LGDLKLFPLLLAKGLGNRVIAVASRRQIGSFMGDQKWYLFLLSLISIMNERFFLALLHFEGSCATDFCHP